MRPLQAPSKYGTYDHGYDKYGYSTEGYDKYGYDKTGELLLGPTLLRQRMQL
jgi:hypothetical protein